MIKRKKEIISLLLSSVLLLSTGCAKKNSTLTPINNIEFQNAVDKDINYNDIKNLYIVKLDNNGNNDYYITKKIPSIVSPTLYMDIKTNKEIIEYVGVPGKHKSKYGNYVSEMNIKDNIIKELGIKSSYKVSEIENISLNIINNYSYYNDEIKELKLK